MLGSNALRDAGAKEGFKTLLRKLCRLLSLSLVVLLVAADISESKDAGLLPTE